MLRTLSPLIGAKRPWRSVPCLEAPDGTILFDGACVLCSGWFRFITKRDPAAQFRFAAIQGAYGRQLAEQLGIDPDAPQTNAVIVGGRAYFRSDAAIEALRRLRGWQWTPLLRVVPQAARDIIYEFVARHRYALFGRVDACWILTPDLRRHIVVEPVR